MFKKVLIAEDQESANLSVQRTLEDLGVPNHPQRYVFYCDHALSWIQNAVRKHEAYDLLITDLSFEADDNQQQLDGGMALIKAAKQAQPDLKVLVFSAENKPAVIDQLFANLSIDAYVRKARNDAKELKMAIKAIYDGKTYLSTDLRQLIKDKNTYEFSPLDITIISLLAEGTLQKDIPLYLQQNDITPSSLSSVEKRLNLMKEVLGFGKNEQLVAYCKDYGFI